MRKGITSNEDQDHVNSTHVIYNAAGYVEHYLRATAQANQTDYRSLAEGVFELLAPPQPQLGVEPVLQVPSHRRSTGRSQKGQPVAVAVRPHTGVQGPSKTDQEGRPLRWNQTAEGRKKASEIRKAVLASGRGLRKGPRNFAAEYAKRKRREKFSNRAWTPERHQKFAATMVRKQQEKLAMVQQKVNGVEVSQQ